MRFVSGGAGAGGSTSALTLALASVLVVVGCTGGPVPIVTHTPSDVPSPTVTASPSPTPSPSATPLTDDELFALMPEGADREDLLGAMITAQFFLEQYGPMFHTGDTRIWEALSTPECGYCADGIGNAKKVTDDGWVVSGADVTVDPTQTQASMTSDTEAAVAMHGTIAEGRMEREGDEDRATGAPGPVLFALRLVYGPDHWLVSVVATQDEAAR